MTELENYSQMLVENRHSYERPTPSCTPERSARQLPPQPEWRSPVQQSAAATWSQADTTGQA